MKETVNVSIASQAFTLDKDAYEVLSTYLKEVRENISADDNETMADVESRLAELFREKKPSAIMVISLSDVRAAMAQLGTPEDFGETQCKVDDSDAKEQSTAEHRLVRSRNDRVFAGVCGGLAEYLGLDVQLLRLATLLLILLGGLSIWVYVILWIVIPEAPMTTKQTK